MTCRVRQSMLPATQDGQDDASGLMKLITTRTKIHIVVGAVKETELDKSGT